MRHEQVAILTTVSHLAPVCSAHDLTIWWAARDFPGRPTRQVSEF
ncbi:hypothetical protein ACH4MA_34460 [Streptomyces roseolus]